MVQWISPNWNSFINQADEILRDSEKFTDRTVRIFTALNKGTSLS